jgi:hypothetical protein
MDAFVNILKLALDRGWALGALLALFCGGILVADAYNFALPTILREWSVAGILFGLTALAVSLASHFIEFGRKNLREFNLKRNILNALMTLTQEEKAFLRPYIAQGTNTRYVSIYDGVANGLQAKKIIYRASSMSVAGAPGLLFPWNLQPTAREMLNDQPNLLD